jgi:hypothetical protein
MNIRLFVILLFAASACANNQTPTDTIGKLHPNRLSFSFDSVTYQILIPIQIDSIIANLMFDTGEDVDLLLDSTFVFTHGFFSRFQPNATRRNYPLMRKFNIPASLYDTTLSLKVGETVVECGPVIVQPLDLKTISGVAINGIFNIPKEDTTHVWELNFEKNYLEIHPTDCFIMPEGCMIFPVLKFGSESNKLYIQIPLQLVYDKDTLKSNYTYLMDTGMSYDMILGSPAEEITYFKNHGDWIWYSGNGNDIFWKNTLKAIAWDDTIIDTLEVYSSTEDHLSQIRDIGINLLKRFNVFFNMKTLQVGLQPIKYQRLKNTLGGVLYFYVDTLPTPQGNYKITFIPHFKDNYYEAAGLRLGDEIVSYNGYLYRDIVQRKVRPDNVIARSDTLIFEILRNGQPIQIIVPIPEDKRKKK